MAAYAGFMTHVTCRLTAKNRDQRQNPTLGNRVWANFYLFTIGRCGFFHVLLTVNARSEHWSFDTMFDTSRIKLTRTLDWVGGEKG